MGCHTWCYKKEKDLTEKELKNLVLKNVKNNLKFALKNKKRLIAKDFSEKMFDKEIKSYNKIIDNINSFSLRKLQNLFNNSMTTEGIIFKMKLYVNSDFHDIFRTGYNDNLKLTSFKQTINFLQNTPCSDIYEEQIQEFWTTYPDGLITVGWF